MNYSKRKNNWANKKIGHHPRASFGLLAFGMVIAVIGLVVKWLFT